MMKKIVLALLIFFVWLPKADACVGRILQIGVVDSTAEKILAEMLLVLVNERTGTTVIIKNYKDPKELYDAVKKNEVGIIIENTDRAMEMLGKPKDDNTKRAYEILKEEFRKNFNFVWLEPFGILSVDKGKGQYYAPVITVEVLTNFPALPRVINKLAGVIDDETYARLMKSEKSGEKPRKIARDFLKSKKLI